MKKICLLLSFISMLLFAPEANAHCDTLDGPVVRDARAALESKDSTPVLKWVPQSSEKAVQTAFEKAIKEREKNREKADLRFFEVLVRLHRESEGEVFTGIKPSGTPVEPGVAVAEKAIESASDWPLIEELSNNLVLALRERFELVMETRKHMNESVEAGRRYISAYVDYLHYVEKLQAAIEGPGHGRKAH